ncbi:alpha/beta hydrolase [Novosphingobium sp. MMS21-SN21R]|uniref:alpha/beta hydrolase n=1 Tax=Novosphingobium sp. MMS21-SN21R TaxID=2969298 RepID=UPI002888F05F|nr:alpha/beta hydrolase [Novosphingobium sp. MMS21-SN21R]MDT0509833.1 alpha/beta hydrolase [Novosphingobium sp. MMS21-SN21R]
MSALTGMAPPPELLERRAAISAAVAAGYFRTDPVAVEIRIAGVRCLRFAAPGTSRGTVMHLHGGAFRMGCPEQVGPFAAALAERCGVDVICPAYRLAPEHPFPSGVDDGMAVLAALAGQDQPLVVSGDSAGGGLAACLAARSHERGHKLAGLVLLSPWLDLTISSPSYQVNSQSDPLFSAESAAAAAALYLQGRNADDPAASPLHADVAGYPPTYINVGSGEVLLDDARAMASKLQLAGVPITLVEVDGMDHVAVTRGPDLPGSAHTFATMTTFIDTMLQ